MDFIVLIIVLGLVYTVFSLVRDRQNHVPIQQPPDTTDLYEIANELDVQSEHLAHPKDVLQSSAFKRGVDLLSSETYSTQDLLNYYTGSNIVIPWIALAALAEREDDSDILEPILKGINVGSWWTRYHALKALNARYDSPIVAAVLVKLDDSWLNTVLLQYLKEFVSLRLAADEKSAFGDLLNEVKNMQVDTLQKILQELGDKLAGSLIAELREWQATAVDTDFLESFGRVWQPSADKAVISHNQLLNHVSMLESTVLASPPRSIIVVGDSGVGKSAVLDVFAHRMHEQGWLIFEAGGVDIQSGQVYIGELEGRLKKLMDKITGSNKVIWVVPDFHALLWAGQHQFSQTGILDFVLPYIERGQIILIGETQPSGYESLLQARRKLTLLFETCRISPLSYEEALEVAKAWAEQYSTDDGTELISRQTLDEAGQLTQQYLSEKALPGSLLQFLQLTHTRLTASDEVSGITISRDDLLVTLTQLTGLPASILDDREGLDLQTLRDFFDARVLGQNEAIDCLVERVAMIKAGLTDPTRPQGVFLFVGPTGTGKTEIAKTLAEFLFGSPNRMIRLDMSEFQELESLSRIIGEQKEMSENTKNAALVNLIRNQPFSVVLLDEFEKAHPNIWDLFLQVFDDGRLTDRRGNTADFRHCIIILTSNLGANIPHGKNIGFTKSSGFTSGSVERAVGQVFRREFLNRLDRIIVFRPLARSVMKSILHKELDQVLERRGLRTRDWAVEWDDSAIDFLLTKGFTPDLGARPLKRAIERYLLAPLSLTIVNHQFPEGEQFLFIGSDGHKIVVEFVDPDAPDEEEETKEKPVGDVEGKDTDLRLESLILDAHGTAAEVTFLRGRYERIKEVVEAEEWQKKKEDALSQTSTPGFWDSPDRFAILGRAEYMDRIETGFSTGGSLLRRLAGSAPGERQYFSRDLLQRLAQQLYLVDAACSGFVEGRPRDAFLLIEGSRETSGDIHVSNAFASRIGNMYRQWAALRKMRLEVLEETDMNGKEPYRLLLSVIGFAAFTILEPEAGLHVLEIPTKGRKDFRRYKVRVRIAVQPEEPAGHEREALRNQALRVFAELDGVTSTIVRRYREEPSPLIRDSVRKWRTGNWQRVLEGNFDLLS